ncbi:MULTISPECIES: cytochrome c biogenesis CcdA family protein [Salinibaculum]|uniref:cytochrome c biogenesis CcdA family protein n=1 Tax=Salinibaculum TaxID=2732368 RepID=UPI0030D58B12
MDGETIRLGFAFSLGTATFFAPCALPLLPGYVAYYVGNEDGDDQPLAARLRRGLVVATVTSLGFLVVFGVLAAITFALGTQVLRNIAVLELVVGVALVGLGIALATGRLSQTTFHIQLPERRRGPVGYFGFGVVYAAAAAGCTAPLFIGVASLALANPANAIPLLGAYAAGMVVLMGTVTLLTALGRQTVVRRLTANTRLVTRVAGVVLAIAGLVQLYYFLFVFDGLAGLA